MPAVIEEVPLLAEAALFLAPALGNVPVIGRLILLLAGGHHGDHQAVEKLAKQADKKKTDRKTRIQRNARYVIKASDAMECVEKNIMNGRFLLLLGRGLLNTLWGQGDSSAPDLMVDRIFTCIEEHVLRQDTIRRSQRTSKIGRPAKGHGYGRGQRAPH